MQKISTCLWYDGQAEEAANFYTSIFPDSRILDTQYYGEAGPGEPGSVMVVTFELSGQRFTGLNGGPEFKFTEAISLEISCANQDEVDHYWQRLGEGGEYVQCGWLKDKFGLSWQVVPTVLSEMLSDPDPAKSQRVMRAMLEMVKLDVPTLERAYAQ